MTTKTPPPLAAAAADESLRALQLQDLEILREFVRICDAHSLRYYLGYQWLPRLAVVPLRMVRKSHAAGEVTP
jgi:hypothetical protein